jgi:hypothetical protein
MKILPVGFKYQEVEIVDDDAGELRRVMAMVPLERFGNVCKRQFLAGDVYTMVPHEARSKRSHNFFMACVGEAYDNLPENVAARFPSATHLRYWALIETGWCTEKEFEFDNKRYAQSLATFIRTEDDYVRISIHQVGPKKWKVLLRRAKSQSHIAMPDKKEFEQSKRDVLSLLEEMTKVPRGTFKKETNRHA